MDNMVNKVTRCFVLSGIIHQAICIHFPNPQGRMGDGQAEVHFECPCSARKVPEFHTKIARNY